MLIYGDPQFTSPLGPILGALGRTLARTHPGDVDTLRAALIQGGQIEQAIADSPDRSVAESLLPPAEALTDALAHAWIAPPAVGEVSAALDRLHEARTRLGRDPECTFKVPEGFEFYALFPEQHRAAAETWLARRAEPADDVVLVVGLRSIGTTLSAVVAATLRRAGTKVVRCTVRPHGHPFDRAATLPPGIPRCAAALIVDEGPGLSGSSLAAVAEAVERAGIEPSRIVFLPGHDGGPGPQAPQRIRERWRHTRCIAVSPEALRWDGQSIAEVLLARTPGGTRSEDMEAAQWRPLVHGAPDLWPAVAPSFARQKVWVWGARPRQPALVWKFVGLGALGPDGRPLAEAALACCRRRAAAGWTPEPAGLCHGFVGTPWVDGTAMRASDAADPAVVERIGHYLVHSAGDVLSRPDQARALARLRSIVETNLARVLPPAELARALTLATAAAAAEPTPRYTDGRMAPGEWRRTPDGRLRKVCPIPHDLDHTCVGPQSLAWDLAGACVEWDLDSPTQRNLVRQLEGSGLSLDFQTVRFHKLAYAAFHYGLMQFSADLSSPGGDERVRQLHAAGRYRCHAMHALAENEP